MLFPFGKIQDRSNSRNSYHTTAFEKKGNIMHLLHDLKYIVRMLTNYISVKSKETLFPFGKIQDRSRYKFTKFISQLLKRKEYSELIARSQIHRKSVTNRVSVHGIMLYYNYTIFRSSIVMVYLSRVNVQMLRATSST